MVKAFGLQILGSLVRTRLFDILDFVRDLFFPLLKNSKSVRYPSRESNSINIQAMCASEIIRIIINVIPLNFKPLNFR